jgi:hypothetical protein
MVCFFSFGIKFIQLQKKILNEIAAYHSSACSLIWISNMFFRIFMIITDCNAN